MEKKEKYILMYKNDEVLSFTVSFGKSSKVEIIKKLSHFDKAPYGMKDDSSLDELKNILFRFLNERTIAGPRWDYVDIIKYTGVKDAFELSFKGHGLSLSNHYWYKKEDENLKYEDINFFTNKWDDSFAKAVLSGNYEALRNVDLNVPDIVTDGWSIKGWLYENGEPRLYKIGIAKDHSEEPLAEVLSSRLAKRMFGSGQSLEYELKEIYGKYASCCKTLIKVDEELIPLVRVVSPTLSNLYSAKFNDHNLTKPFFEELSKCDIPGIYEFFIKLSCWRTLCFANDLHFNNLSVIRNIKTGQMRLAPLFDFGSSFGGSEKARAFLSHPNKASYLIIYFLYGDLDPNWDYSWYHKESLDGFEEEIKETLSKSEFYTPELIQNILNVYHYQKDSLTSLAEHKSN